ncbi:907_t:CDS:1, partial [Acaulospora colombiana]
MSLELEMDPLSEDTKTPNASSNSKNSSEKTPLLPIASKYYTSSSNPRIYSSFSDYLPNSFLSWIPHPVISTVSYLSSKVSTTSSAIISHIPIIPLSHITSSISS